MKVKLHQPNHTGKGNYYFKKGAYYGYYFDLDGDDLVCEVSKDDEGAMSLVDSGKFIPLEEKKPVKKKAKKDD